MKIHGFKMTEHVYNGLIRTYAGAAAVRHVKEEHIDMYIKDSWELFQQLEQNPDAKVNIYVLNSLLLLHTNALRVEELDSNILPLYEKHRIPHDIYTYQSLSKMYLNMGDYEMVKSLYKKMKGEKFGPN